MCKGDVLLAEHVQFENDQETGPSAETHEDLLRSLKQRVADLVPEILRLADQRAHANLIDLVEEALISRALEQCGHNQVRTARLLGISRNTLRHRIKKYNLEPPGE
jgi:DNA-binding protein Fis